MEHEYIDCDCTSFEHTIKLMYINNNNTALPPMMYVHYYLESNGLWQRVINATKHILGRKSRFGDFGETLWNRAQVRKYMDFCQKFLDETA